MRIWHVNIGNHAGPVDGVAVISTQLARDQAEAGHDVRLFVSAAAAHHDAIRAEADGVTLVLGPTPGQVVGSARRLLAGPASRPDVVHLHSVFRPAHRVLATAARRRGIAVVTSPHAGLAPDLLARDRARKAVYGRLIERRFHRTVDGVHALQQVEADDVRTYCGDPRRCVEVIANPSPPSLAGVPRWRAPVRPEGRRPRIVMLSRYDVYQKGLDRVVAMGRARPDLDIAIHGSADKNAPEAAARLQAEAPPNVGFRPPVHGDDKYALLLQADVFLQPSRVEGLSVALVEAMALGVPCAVSTYVARSLEVDRNGTALVLDDDPSVAAGQVAALAGDPRRAAALGARAAAFAAERFAPAAVAEAHVAHYERLTAGGVRSDVSCGSLPSVTTVG